MDLRVERGESRLEGEEEVSEVTWALYPLVSLDWTLFFGRCMDLVYQRVGRM